MVTPNTLNTRFVFIALFVLFSVGLAAASVENTNTENTYATIQEAIDNATSGDTIEISGGTYSVDLVIESLTDLTLTAAPSETPVIQGELRINAGSDGTEISGLRFEDVSRDLQAISITGSSNILITQNEFYGYKNHVQLDIAGPTPSDITISKNLFEGANDEGTSIAGTEDVSNITIIDNEFVDNRNSIGIGLGATGVTIEGNDFSAGEFYLTNRDPELDLITYVFDNNDFDRAVGVHEADISDLTQWITTSVQQGVQTAAENSLVEVLPGTYEETLNGFKDGITLRGAGSDLVTIDVAGAARGIDVEGLSSSFLNDIVLEGFTVTNSDANSFALKVAFVNNLEISDVHAIDNGGTGIDLNTINQASLTDIVVSENTGAGLALRNMNDVTVHNLQTTQNDWGGLALWAQTGEELSDITVSGSTFSNEPAGVFVQHPGTYNNIQITTSTFEDNLVQVTDQTGVDALDLSTILDDNTFDNAVIVSVNPIVVPAIFSSIQDAIDAASPGETVEVYPGTYVESLEILTNDLTLQSVSGAAATIIDANSATNAISIGEFTGSGTHPTGVTVEGFTVENWVERGIAQRNGDGTVFVINNVVEAQGPGNRNNAILISGGQGSEIRGNTVTSYSWNNPSWESAAILLMGSVDAIVENNVVYGADRGITILGAPQWENIDTSWVTASGNTIRQNTILNTPVGIAIEGIAIDTTVEQNTIEDTDVGFWMFDQSGGIPSGILIQENNFENNPIALRFSSSQTSDIPVLRQNNILADTGVFSDIELDARENWWGCSEGPSYMDCSSVAGSGEVSFTPWLCQEAVSSLTSETDSCGLSTGTINVLYYGEDASWTQAQDKLRVWGQSPVGARTAVIDIRQLDQTVIKSESVEVETVGANQRVYDEFFDINNWPDERLQIHVSFLDSNEDLLEGYTVGAMFNDLFLLALDDIVAEHEQHLQDLQAALELLEADVDANADEITDLQQDVSDLTDAIEQLQEDIEALEEDLAEVASDVADLQIQVEDLQEQVDAIVALFNHATINWVYYDADAAWGVAADSLRVFGQAPLGAETAEVVLRHLNQSVIASETVNVGTITNPSDDNKNSYQHFFEEITDESIYPREQLQIHVRFYDEQTSLMDGYNLEGLFNNLYLMQLRDNLAALNESIDVLNQTMIEEFETVYSILDTLVGHGTLQYRYYSETSEYKFQGAIPAVADFNPRFWVVNESGDTVYQTTNINDFKYGPHNPLHGEEYFWKLVVDADSLGSGIFTVNMNFDTTSTEDRWSVGTISELALEDLQEQVMYLFEQLADLNSGTINSLYYSPSASWTEAQDALRVWGQAPLGADTAVVVLRDLDQDELESVTVSVNDLQDNPQSYNAFIESFSNYPSAQYQVLVKFYMNGDWMAGYNVATMFSSHGLLQGPYPVNTSLSGLSGVYAQGVYWTNQSTLGVRGVFDDRIIWQDNECVLQNMNINEQGDSTTLRQNTFALTNASCMFSIDLLGDTNEYIVARDSGSPEYELRVCGTPREMQGDRECNTVTVGYDTQAPQIDLGSLVPQESTIMSGNFTFQANVVDNSGVQNVSFYLINKTNATDYHYLGTAVTSVNNTWNVTYDTTSIPDGWYNFSVTATDYAGNSETVMIDPLVDNTAPVIHEVSHGGYSGTGHSISAQISDNYAGVANATALVTYSLEDGFSDCLPGSGELVLTEVENPRLIICPQDGEVAATVEKWVNLSLSEGNSSNGTWTGEFDFDYLGDFEIVVYAADYANNEAEPVGTEADARLGFTVSLSPLEQTVNSGAPVSFSGSVTPGLNRSWSEDMNSTVLVNGEEFSLDEGGVFSANIGTLASGQTHTVTAQYAPGEWMYNNASDVFNTTAQVTVNSPPPATTGGGGGGGNVQTGAFLGDQPTENESETFDISSAPEEQESEEQESAESTPTEDVFAGQQEDEVPAQQPTEEAEQSGGLLTAAVAGVGAVAGSAWFWVLALAGLIAGGLWFAKRP